MGSTYYCLRCASSVSGSAPIETSALTGSQYQLDKIIKHTAPQKQYQLNSVFASPDFQMYKDWIVSSSVSGALEVDERGRHNLLYVAGQTVGVTYVSGSFHTHCDTVKVVLPYSSGSIHAFPTSAADLTRTSCAKCGGPAVY